MPLTKFPDGVAVGSGEDYPLRSDSDSKFAYGTIVVPSGGSGTAFTVTGITTIDYVAASPYSSVATVAGFAGVAASHAGGSVTLIGISGAGTASTANGTATYIVIGS